MQRVLELCTGNSCRLQMLHGYLAQDRSLEVASAGVDPHGLNPGAVAAMAEVGSTSRSTPQTMSTNTARSRSTSSLRCATTPASAARYCPARAGNCTAASPTRPGPPAPRTRSTPPSAAPATNSPPSLPTRAEQSTISPNEPHLNTRDILTGHMRLNTLRITGAKPLATPALDTSDTVALSFVSTARESPTRHRQPTLDSPFRFLVQPLIRI